MENIDIIDEEEVMVSMTESEFNERLCCEHQKGYEEGYNENTIYKDKYVALLASIHNLVILAR